MNSNKSFLYPFVRQSPLLRWQFSPEKPGGQTHRYRPSPVSMQVALIAQGLDEHKRISVVKRERKKNTNKYAVFRSCGFSLSPCVSVADFSSRLCFHSHTTVPTTASCHQEQNWEHNQLRYTGKWLICSNRIKDALCVLIKRSHWAGSQKKISLLLPLFLPLFLPLLQGLQVLLCDNGHYRYYDYNQNP